MDRIEFIYFQNLLIDKVCRVNLGLSEEVCSNLDDHKEDQIQVQKMTANFAMYTLVISKRRF